MSGEFWAISIGALILTPFAYHALRESPGVSFVVVVVILIASFLIRLSKQKLVPAHELVVRDGVITGRGGEQYWPHQSDVHIQLRPDSETLRSPNSRPVFLRWRPSEEHIAHYVAQFPAARKQFVDTIQALLEVRPDPSIEYLNELFSEQFGVSFLGVEGQPEPEPPKKKTAKERREQAFQDFMDETGTYSKWIVLGEEYIKQHPEDFPDEESKRAFRAKVRNLVHDFETGQRP